MTRRRKSAGGACACGCGQPVPAGRAKYASAQCSKRAEKARARERTQTVEKPAPVYGERRGNLVFVPGHPLARRTGWAGVNRLTAFEARGGVAVCDATGEPLEWRAAKVVDNGGTSAVLCEAHTKLRYLGLMLAEGTFAGPVANEVLDRLGELWTMPCPARGESSLGEGERDHQTPPEPIQAPRGSRGSVHPLQQVGIS